MESHTCFCLLGCWSCVKACVHCALSALLLMTMDLNVLPGIHREAWFRPRGVWLHKSRHTRKVKSAALGAADARIYSLHQLRADIMKSVVVAMEKYVLVYVVKWCCYIVPH